MRIFAGQIVWATPVSDLDPALPGKLFQMCAVRSRLVSINTADTLRARDGMHFLSPRVENGRESFGTKVGAMQLPRSITTIAVALACVGLVIPSEAFAQSPIAPPAAVAAAPVVAITDVQLHQGGTLVGQIVNADGAPLKATEVRLQQAGAPVTSTVTNEKGFFKVSELRGGVYQVAAADGYGTYRMWAVNTAPPAAKPGVLLVSGNTIVRGQQQGYVYWLTNPWVLAGLIGAAITIPIALNNDDDSSS